MSERQSARARQVGDRAASTLNAAIAVGVLVAVKHAFFTPPVPLPPAAPGALIRSERLLGAPSGATAWLVMYHSTDLHGQDIPVSGA